MQSVLTKIRFLIEVISTAKMCWMQVAMVVLIAISETIQSTFANRFENPFANVTPVLIFGQTFLWFATLGAFWFDLIHNKRIPLWCKIFQGFIGMLQAVFLIGMIKFVFG